MLTKAHYLDLLEGKFHETTADDLAKLFDALEKSAKQRLVVHLHGGLVSRASAEQTAEGLMPFYEQGGAYPVFFFWHSDLWTVLQHNVTDIAQEEAFKRLVKRLVQLALGKLASFVGARAAGPLVLTPVDTMPDDLEALAQYAAAREPAPQRALTVQLNTMQSDQAEAELETDDVLQTESEAIAASNVPPASAAGVRHRAGGAKVTPRPSRMSGSVQKELAAEAGKSGERIGAVTFFTLVKHGIAILKRVIERFAKGRAHGVYTTVVEEVLRDLYMDSVGAIAWETMKKDTGKAFGNDPNTYAGTAFLERLKNWCRPGRSITLICHSCGAVYACNFLKHADGALDPAVKFDFVFMAPACTFAVMAEQIPIFVKRVQRFRMYALKDELEHGYWEVPLVYPASLLYMVSALFEGDACDMPIVGMQRYHTNADPYIAPEIQAVTKYLQGKCVWSIAQDGPGLSTAAKKHGDFSIDAATRESLRDFLLGTGGN